MEKNSQIKTRQMPFMKQIAKFSSRQYFLLYGITVRPQLSEYLDTFDNQGFG